MRGRKSEEGGRRESSSPKSRRGRERAQLSCLLKGGRQGEGPCPRYRGRGSKVYKREGE